MSADIMEVGPCPSEEEAAQVGNADFSRRNMVECRAYKEQILRAYGEPPEGASLRIVANHHEFGTYREVAVRVDVAFLSPEEAQAAWDYAYRIEGDDAGALRVWDDLACVMLGLKSPEPHQEAEVLPC